MCIPKYYKKQHELLGLLIDKSRENAKTGTFSATDIEIKKETLAETLRLTVDEFMGVTWPLVTNDDIKHQTTKDGTAYFIGNNGANSFYYKKYLVEGRKYAIEKVFDYLKVISGIVLLIIGIITFIVNTLYTYNTQMRLQRVEQEIKANTDSIRAIKGHR